MTDISRMTNLVESLKGIAKTVEETTGYSRKGDTVPSILSVTENALFAFIDVLSLDYNEIIKMIDFRLKFTTSQTMTLMALYVKRKAAVRESSEFILQYMSQMGVSLENALDRNNINLLSLIQSYHGTVLALAEYTNNVETRHMVVPGSDRAPRTLYSSKAYRDMCHNAIEATLTALERVKAILNETMAGQFSHSDLVAMISLDNDCFGDFLTVASNVTDKLSLASVDRYQEQVNEVLNRLKSINIRELLDPIIQLQLDLEHLVYHYVRNDIGKLDLALQIQGLADGMLNECENVVRRASTDILEPMENLIGNIKQSLGNNYKMYFDSVMLLSPLLYDSVLYRLTSNMRIWFRPIIKVAGTSVTIKMSQSLEDVYQYVTLDEILPNNSYSSAREYIAAAFEQPLKVIRSAKQQLEVLRREMSQTVNALLENTAIYVQQTEMNENFVK